VSARRSGRFPRTEFKSGSSPTGLICQRAPPDHYAEPISWCDPFGTAGKKLSAISAPQVAAESEHGRGSPVWGHVRFTGIGRSGPATRYPQGWSETLSVWVGALLRPRNPMATKGGIFGTLMTTFSDRRDQGNNRSSHGSESTQRVSPAHAANRVLDRNQVPSL